MKHQYISILFILATSCSPKENNQKITALAPQIPNKTLQDSIIKEHLENGAWRNALFSMEWQAEIDKGLAKDSTIAYLWQQKAMPQFKQGKYELGMQNIDQAVKYDRNEWQEYRAFMKCIFAKTYRAAIEDFEDCKRRKGNGYVMDHSYDFYIALSKIQLNEFADAEILLEKEVERQLKSQGEEWVHHLDLFYLGIAKYEQSKYEETILVMDRTLKLDSKFSEAIYFKAKALEKLGRREDATPLIRQAIKYGKQGHTVNEDNSLYERYPYQMRWELWD